MIEAVLLTVSVAGFTGIGCAIWAVNRTLRAQGQTIEAQAGHLSSFDTLLKSMKAALESTDEPAMRRRLKAYKEFVEHERDAARRRRGARRHNRSWTVLQDWPAFRGLGEPRTVAAFDAAAPARAGETFNVSLSSVFQGRRGAALRYRQPDVLRHAAAPDTGRAADLRRPAARASLRSLHTQGVRPRDPRKATSAL